MVEKKSVIGSLIVTLLLGGAILITLISGGVQFKIDKYQSVFYVQENNEWVVSGIEKNYLSSPTGDIIKPKSSKITTVQKDNNLVITRVVSFKNNMSIIDKYTFLTDDNDVVKFPFKHEINVLNARDYILIYEVKNLEVLPSSVLENNVISFGKQMDLVIDPKYAYYQVGTSSFIAAYPVATDNIVFKNRLFDPPPTPDTATLYYSFDSWVSNSTQANDTTGNNYHGTVSNAILILE